MLLLLDLWYFVGYKELEANSVIIVNDHFHSMIQELDLHTVVIILWFVHSTVMFILNEQFIELNRLILIFY